MKTTILRNLKEKISTGSLVDRALKAAKEKIEKITNRVVSLAKDDMKYIVEKFGTEIIITEDGHVDFYIIARRDIDTRISYIRVANWQPEFSLGDVFLDDGSSREYKKLGNIVNALNKEYSKYGFDFQNVDTREINKIAKKEYQIYIELKEQQAQQAEKEEEKMENKNFKYADGNEVRVGDIVEVASTTSLNYGCEGEVLDVLGDDGHGEIIIDTTISKDAYYYASELILIKRKNDEAAEEEKEEEVKMENKKITISIEGEGRAESITTGNIEEANANLRKRIDEVLNGTYCNKTWITIDIREFEEPIEFRVDIIEELHGKEYNVLELLINEMKREIKYMKENKNRCTWIKDTDKFISVREQVVEVLRKYLQPNPPAGEPAAEAAEVTPAATEEKENNKKNVEEMETKITTKQRLNNRLKKLAAQLVEEKTIQEKEDIVYSLFPNAIELDVEESSIHFLADEEYIGAKPTKKYMMEIDENFGKINNMYGLMVSVHIKENAVEVEASVAVDFSDVWGNQDYTDFIVGSAVAEIPMTDKKAMEIASDALDNANKRNISISSALHTVNELLQCKGLSEKTMVALKSIMDVLKDMHLRIAEIEEIERANNMIGKIENAYNEGRADACRCLAKIDEKIKSSRYKSTKLLYQAIRPKFEQLAEQGKNSAAEIEITNNTGKQIYSSLVADVIKNTDNKKIFGDNVIITYADLSKVEFESDMISLRIDAFREYKFNNRKEIKIDWRLFDARDMEIDEDFDCVYGTVISRGQTVVVVPNEPTPEPEKNKSGEGGYESKMESEKEHREKEIIQYLVDECNLIFEVEDDDIWKEINKTYLINASEEERDRVYDAVVAALF